MMTGTATDNQTGKRVTIKAADLFRIENKHDWRALGRCRPFRYSVMDRGLLVGSSYYLATIIT